jgi:hypothetical protein
MDLRLLCFNDSLKLGIFCLLIAEFIFESLNFGFELVENDWLDTFELKSIEDKQEFKGIIIDTSHSKVTLQQQIFNNIKGKGRIGVDSAGVEYFGWLCLNNKFLFDDLKPKHEWRLNILSASLRLVSLAGWCLHKWSR